MWTSSLSTVSLTLINEDSFLVITVPFSAVSVMIVEVSE